jgi:hypothetical protein
MTALLRAIRQEAGKSAAAAGRGAATELRVGVAAFAAEPQREMDYHGRFNFRAMPPSQDASRLEHA